jgi:hypothetical protein
MALPLLRRLQLASLVRMPDLPLLQTLARLLDV